MPDRPDPDQDVLDVDDETWDDEHEDLLYLKYAFEGRTTLGELSIALRALAADSDDRAHSGWRLAAPVDSGYAPLVRDDA